MSEGAVLASIFVGGAALLGLMVLGANELERVRCHDRAQLMRMQANYGFMTGCMVKHKGEWWPIKNVRSID